MANKTERLNQLINALKENGGLTISELANILDVTEITIRRYLQELTEEKRVKYLSRGVVLTEPGYTTVNQEKFYDYNRAISSREEEKIRIGRKAAELVEPYDTILIDSGSTTEYLAKAIPDDLPVTILAYALNIINIICAKPACKPIISGGTFYKNTLSFIGTNGIELIDRLRASKVFVSASGVSDNLGVTCTNLYEIDVKKAAMKSSHTKILLLDSSKFNQVKVAPIADLKDFDIIVTDSNIPEHYIRFAEKHRITLHIV
jgi:DeoR family transcriptional regulator, deoxyribose operon repressor